MGDQTVIQLEEGWNNEIKAKALDRLEELLDGGFHQTSKLFSNKDYMAVYTICYNMCTQRPPNNYSEQLYHRHGEQIARYLTDSVLPVLQSKQNAQLLRELVKRSDNHKIMNKWYKQFFQYLDRYYVKYHSLPTLEEAGLRHFKTLIFDNVKREAVGALMRLIDEERDGGQVDRQLIRSCVNIFEGMGMGSLEVYVNDFEGDLLESSRSYYARKAATWLQEDSTPVYLLKVEAALEAESNRIKHYLLPESEAKLFKVLDDELLVKYETELLEKEGSGARSLLFQEQLEDLARMYRLFGRVSGGLAPLAEILRKFIVEVGNDKMDSRLNRSESSSSSSAPSASAGAGAAPAATGGDNDDPALVRDLLHIHDKFMSIVTNQFASNGIFQKALKDAFVEVVNRDVSISTGGGSSSSSSSSSSSAAPAGGVKQIRTAELISTFVDRALKSGSAESKTVGSDAELEELLEKVVSVFVYLSDKDLFQDVYRTQLAKRLLNARSASDEMEKLMIAKLKLKCGAQFTAKMEGMLNDLSIGTDHARAFEDHVRAQAAAGNAQAKALTKMEFTVQVLTTGYWPTYKACDVVLPPVMQRCTTVFKEFYDNRAQHRRLQWVHILGSATIKATFPRNKVYDLTMVTVQAVVLLYFNFATATQFNGDYFFANTNTPTASGGNTLVAFPTLLEDLNIPDEILKRVLHSLSCGKFKILKRLAQGATADSSSSSSSASTSKGSEKEKESKEDRGPIRPTDMFCVNDAFTCPMRKVRIPMASLEDAHSVKKVEEDRSIAIEAAIVRIMKARKTLSHQQLIAEVLAQLAFFRPDPKIIKRRIEALIDREYLERDSDNSNIYKYLA